MIDKTNLIGGIGTGTRTVPVKKQVVKPPLKAPSNGTSPNGTNVSLATQARLINNIESSPVLPKLDESLGPNEARRKFELFDKTYIKQREEKKEVALKIAQFLKVSYEDNKKIFDKHCKKSVDQINKELETADENLKEELKQSLYMRTKEYKKTFFKLQTVFGRK